ncbi:MAG: hypothetical protein ABFC80_08150 [Coriobacteriales bacterium]
MAYTSEFRTEAVRLYRLGGRGIKATAHQISVAPDTLRNSGILASVGEMGVPHDDAVTESMMATIKKDCVDRHWFKTTFAIFDHIEGFYNPHPLLSRFRYIRYTRLISGE